MYGHKYTEEEKLTMSKLMKSLPTPPKCLEILNQIHKNQQTPVIQYDLHGKYIAEFDGIQTAARKTHSQASLIHKVLTGKRHQTNGFIWKYKKR